jgi:hypothetical protein
MFLGIHLDELHVDPSEESLGWFWCLSERRFVSPSPKFDNLFAACVDGNFIEILVPRHVNHIVL